MHNPFILVPLIQPRPSRAPSSEPQLSSSAAFCSSPTSGPKESSSGHEDFLQPPQPRHSGSGRTTFLNPENQRSTGCSPLVGLHLEVRWFSSHAFPAAIFTTCCAHAPYCALTINYPTFDQRQGQI